MKLFMVAVVLVRTNFQSASTSLCLGFDLASAKDVVQNPESLLRCAVRQCDRFGSNSPIKRVVDTYSLFIQQRAFLQGAVAKVVFANLRRFT
jgi:hypothetical protein